ncbi:hypothetical protein WJX84_000495 [Apatococcus fuscideae]|uniref:phytol kinase n=1 Tax=Apatococcus fuscideae TaxID=2026836 RepID=A0AAW1SJ43_9CHLO
MTTLSSCTKAEIHRNCRLFVGPLSSTALVFACNHSSRSQTALTRLRQPVRRTRLTSTYTGALAANSTSIVETACASPYRDSLATGLALVAAVIWVKIFEHLAQKGILEQKLSRKLVHISSGPLFVLTWPLFSADPSARLFATLIPVLNALRLLLVGSGVVQDVATVKSVSRQGDRQELLRGPLYYCLVLIAGTLLYWRESPVGILALALMCGGDGLADVVGRQFGTARLPFNPDKSWAGSLAMLLGGAACAYALVSIFCSLGYIPCSSSRLLRTICITALMATFTEALPINQKLDDNISVPGIAVLTATLLLRQGL